MMSYADPPAANLTSPYIRTQYCALSRIVWCTTNISLRSYSPLPVRRSSASRKLSVEKAQQVPDLCWSLTDVMGMSLTVVKMNPVVSL